jgi:hypothetical protein
MHDGGSLTEADRGRVHTASRYEVGQVLDLCRQPCARGSDFPAATRSGQWILGATAGGD